MAAAERELIDFVLGQRWFGSRTQHVTHAAVVDRATLRAEEPALELQLVGLRFDTGLHETYQLLVDHGLDALGDVRQVRELVHRIRAGARLPAGQGIVEFGAVEWLAELGAELREARVIASEQSNTSIVFDDELILKVFRRVDAGINPELELLRFLTERGFENIARLGGWYAYSGRQMDATLGILQQFIVGATDGWQLALDAVEEESDEFVATLTRLGEVTGEMHTLLGSDQVEPSFVPEEPSAESLGLLVAAIDDEIESVFVNLPDGEEELEPIRGHGQDVRERLRELGQIGDLGRVIRNHGDFHLGQALWTGEDWIVIDFEGEPARTLPERRRKRSPLRDVAGMLRSFSYAVSVSELVRGVVPPTGWEDRARAAFLEGYLSTIDPVLVPSSNSFDRLLAVFELGKAVYELRYELDHRPDWVGIPVAGITRMLDGEFVP
jgi:maltokinase